VLLYTDGLLELPVGTETELLGEEGLAQLVNRVYHPGFGLEGLIEHVLASAREGRFADDALLLLLEREP